LGRRKAVLVEGACLASLNPHVLYEFAHGSNGLAWNSRAQIENLALESG